jgi:hypothetical protein
VWVGCPAEQGKLKKNNFPSIFLLFFFPSSSRMEAYYRRLGADTFNVEVKCIDDQRGKGCFATAQFEDHDVVFRDRALACLQSRKQAAESNDTGWALPFTHLPGQRLMVLRA